MDENNGILAAMKVLGDKINQLESDLRYERMCKENAEQRAAAIVEENTMLVHKLEKVQHFIERMEGR